MTPLRCLPALAALVVFLSPARADVTPHALFSDGAVLQSGGKASVWGKAAPEEKVSVELGGSKNDHDAVVTAECAADKSGAWRCALDVSKMKPGTGYTLAIKGKNTVTVKDVALGEVWVCSGQSNMEWSVNSSLDPDKTKAESANPNIRLFTVPRAVADKPQTSINSKWQPCGPQTVGSFSAVGYHFGRKLQSELGVPVGLLHTSWGGTICEAWTSQEALAAVPELKSLADAAKNRPDPRRAYLDALEKYVATARKALDQDKDLPTLPQLPRSPNPNVPTVLYNAMISPLLPYTVRGAVWYQGESNANRAAQYRTLLPTMIKDWRDRFDRPDLGFFIVQLAPFMKITKEPVQSGWAELREAQLLTALNDPNAGLAVITDSGEENDIHPKAKQPVGERLALAALGVTYKKPIVYSGPVYKSMSAEGDKVVLSFDHVGGGLVVKGGELTGFAVAGPDGKFVSATAEVKGDKVVVTGPGVSEPKAVRYGWANYPVVNLFNKDGLPASPFRTDGPAAQPPGKN